MKNISKILLLSTSCIICYEARDVYASFISDTVPWSGIHIYTTQPHLTSDYPHLPHPRGVAESSPREAGAASPHRFAVGCSVYKGNAMLTSCLSQAQSGNRQCHPRRSAATSGDPGENMEALFNLDVRVKPEHDIRVASVCFITDAGNCSGEKFSNDETPGNGGNGNPGGIPDYDTPQEQCQAAGYKVTSCPAGSHGDNPCPADSAYYQKCVCDANMTQTCTKPYYGVGPSCEGKYASCKRDDDKACKEDGFSQTVQCSSVQTPNKKCSYNSGYYDKCVCRSDLVTCSYPQTGVGEACGGKYASCQCPSSYKSCECGGAAGATSCTVNGVTTYSSCKDCCNSSNPRWCSVHSSCHGDCCTDGSIESCDERCGGSGCSSSGGDSGSSGSGSGGYDCSCVGNQASPCPSSYYQKTNMLTCGATCYHCYRGVNQYRDVPRGSCYYSEASKRWILNLDLEKCCSSTGQCGILRGTSGRSFSSESECNATAASLPNSPLKPATNDYCDQAW